jgi:hypothetical protein
MQHQRSRPLLLTLARWGVCCTGSGCMCTVLLLAVYWRMVTRLLLLLLLLGLGSLR